MVLILENKSNDKLPMESGGQVSSALTYKSLVQTLLKDDGRVSKGSSQLTAATGELRVGPWPRGPQSECKVVRI